MEVIAEAAEGLRGATRIDLLVGSPWSWSRIRVFNRRSSLFAPPNSAAQRARERIGDVAARKGRIETAVHRGNRLWRSRLRPAGRLTRRGYLHMFSPCVDLLIRRRRRLGRGPLECAARHAPCSTGHRCGVGEPPTRTKSPCALARSHRDTRHRADRACAIGVRDVPRALRQRGHL